jgi:general secretion pathway protein D
MELVRGSVAPDSWETGTINAQGKNLVVYNSPEVQGKVAEFLDDLRAFSGLVITIETRFLGVTDAFLRDVGVDFRGLGGQNGGPLAVLDDVTSGLDDNASAGLDNSGPGVDAGGAALAPSSGLYFNDENIYSTPLGQILTALGGGTFQVTFLDDFAVSAIVRATEKTARMRQMTAPSLTVYNTQRANLTVVNQISFVQDFDVEVAQTAFIADPVIGVIQDGLTLDVRPTISNDRQYVTLELRPTIADLQTPIKTFQTLLGASIATVSAQNPVTIQLPEIDLRVAESTVRMPDGGSILLGGLKDIRSEDKKSTTPVLGNIPVLSALFSRKGKSEEIEHLMIVVTATITDLTEQAQRMRG